ncbi:transcriptional regulator [Candidatus Venteria ishoeyi]|uniref:transcriptional regulator n=1 Tax=Candidatus Venteria ishoeyi TaxID=1899563 RepID=UPI0025A5E0B8|nr:transcriptional regulator [Candidatus Venteria ishoeyi]MDM8544994.1 transcriptional regulator [Candidatus Venteria ishoeyi]
MNAESLHSHKGRYAYERLERVIHEKARLGILTSLLTQPEGLLFSELRDLVGLTDGNLSRHLKVLQEESLVSIQKAFVNNRPQTTCLLTEDGRERFLNYLQALEQVIKDAETATKKTTKSESAWLAT